MSVSVPPLALRSQELLEHLTRALDGQLDVGQSYGAVMKEGKPDLYASLEHASVGLVELLPNNEDGVDFINSSLYPKSTLDHCKSHADRTHCRGHEGERDLNLGASVESGWVPVSTAAWPTVIQDAARANVLVATIATRDDVPDAEPDVHQAILPNGLKIAVIGGGEHGQDAVEALGEMLGDITLPPREVEPEAPQESSPLIELLARARTTAKPSNLDDEDDTGPFAVTRSAMARFVHLMKSGFAPLAPFVRPYIRDGVYATPLANPEDPESADLQASCLLSNGLVRLASRTARGRRFLDRALINTPGASLAVVTPREDDPSEMDTVVSLINWPAIVGLATSFDISIRLTMEWPEEDESLQV